MGSQLDLMRQHPDLEPIIHSLASAFVTHHDANRRVASTFGTQQRWLLAHAAMALYFRGEMMEGPPLHSSAFLQVVDQHKIAARNTAHAFLKEMLHYGIVQYRNPTAKNNIRVIGLSDAAISAIQFWLELHLMALDAFDGGKRLAKFQKNSTATAILQPAVADILLASKTMRVPSGTFSLFTWLNNGGLVMDWLMVGLQPVAAGATRIPTGVSSISDLADRLKLSRTNLGRKLRDAEELGSIGWSGHRGKSTMWISTEFREDYYTYQIGKLLIIDTAFHAVAERIGT